ncbi:MAG: formate dehydrogenase [Candidatus Thiodiazotropha sp. (ex Myrtea spinifera)]|nr:formate dehydrogenase [Candidatus Thiodiazotropha sp. (ex Myrtea spinifera)]
MKKANKYSLDHKRRRFLRDTATVGAGVAVAVTLPGLAATTAEDEAPAETMSQKGYRLTPHIAAYYETMIS